MDRRRRWISHETPFIRCYTLVSTVQRRLESLLPFRPMLIVRSGIHGDTKVPRRNRSITWSQTANELSSREVTDSILLVFVATEKESTISLGPKDPGSVGRLYSSRAKASQKLKQKPTRSVTWPSSAKFGSEPFSFSFCQVPVLQQIGCPRRAYYSFLFGQLYGGGYERVVVHLKIKTNCWQYPSTTGYSGGKTNNSRSKSPSSFTYSLLLSSPLLINLLLSER